MNGGCSGYTDLEFSVMTSTKKMSGHLTTNEENMKDQGAGYSADVLNPFVCRQRLTTLLKIKVALLSLTLAPAKLLLMLLVLVVTWALGSVMLLGMRPQQAHGLEPLSGWRRRYAKPLVVYLARLVLWVGGWRWERKGRRAPAAEAPLLLVAPHSSFLDAAAVIALSCPGMVVQHSTTDAPFFGRLIAYSQPLLVRSEDPDSRRKVSEQIRTRVRSDGDWDQLLIFPEGGCGNRKALLHFKLGGFNPGVPVQPVFIRYKNNFDTITWSWDGPGALRQLWLSLCQFRIYGELEFLPVYRPSKFEQENPRCFADNVESFISKYTGTPVSKFAVDDARYLQIAKAKNLPSTAAIAKLLRLRKSIGRQEELPSVEARRLSEGNNNLLVKRGDVHVLASYLGLQRCPESLRDFYAVLDQHGEKNLDVRVYTAGLCLLREDLEPAEKLKAAFQAFGAESEADNLSAVLLMWKGVPTPRHSAFKNLAHTDAFTEEEQSNRCR